MGIPKIAIAATFSALIAACGGSDDEKNTEEATQKLAPKSAAQTTKRDASQPIDNIKITIAGQEFPYMAFRRDAGNPTIATVEDCQDFSQKIQESFSEGSKRMDRILKMAQSMNADMPSHVTCHHEGKEVARFDLNTPTAD
ncbi:MAG: hypothetical protein ACRBDL_08745 [Alphaproteobacteria bacterium]